MLLRIILAAVLAGLVQADYCFVPLSADGSAPVRVCINNETGQATASVLGQEHVEQDIRNSWVVNAAILVFCESSIEMISTAWLLPLACSLSAQS